MAKELPYFKFEPSEWLEGEIQICSDVAIVCFIDLCSGYWLKLGCISYAFALQKYCRKDAKVLQELIDNQIIRVENENIRIKFLDKQLEEFNSVSEKRRKSAETRWNNANALQSQSKSNAIREDKNRGDEIKEKKSKEELLLSRKKIFASTLEPFVSIYGKEMLNDFYKYWTEPNKSGTKFKQEMEKTWSLERRLETWAKNDFNKKSVIPDKPQVFNRKSLRLD